MEDVDGKAIGLFHELPVQLVKRYMGITTIHCFSKSLQGRREKMHYVQRS